MVYQTVKYVGETQKLAKFLLGSVRAPCPACIGRFLFGYAFCLYQHWSCQGPVKLFDIFVLRLRNDCGRCSDYLVCVFCPRFLSSVPINISSPKTAACPPSQIALSKQVKFVYISLKSLHSLTKNRPLNTSKKSLTESSTPTSLKSSPNKHRHAACSFPSYFS